MEDFIYKKIDDRGNTLELKATLYSHSSDNLKGVLLYFHGGGLLYGSRKDLPKLHIKRLNESGYSILSFDYRLAPEAKFNLILEDVLDSINFFIDNKDRLELCAPYFLWGRSAGAYLALLSSTQDLKLPPKGIISYYGYGFTVPDWFNTSSLHYLKYPRIKEEQVQNIIEDRFIAEGDINKRYALYMYGRQTGKWILMISNENEKEFLDKYSLLNISKDFSFPPTFIAHSFIDEDVPFQESIGLSKLIKESILFTCSAKGHDFDSEENNKNTIELLNKTIEFLDSQVL